MVWRLVQCSDVVIDNFAEVMDRRGLSYGVTRLEADTSS